MGRKQQHEMTTKRAGKLLNKTQRLVDAEAEQQKICMLLILKFTTTLPQAVLDRHKPYMTDYWPLLDILPRLEISLMASRLPSLWEGSLFCGVQTKLGDITASKLMKTSCPHQRTWRQLVIMSCNIHTVDIALLNFQSLGNLDKKSEFIYCHFYDVS